MICNYACLIPIEWLKKEHMHNNGGALYTHNKITSQNLNGLAEAIGWMIQLWLTSHHPKKIIFLFQNQLTDFLAFEVRKNPILSVQFLRFSEKYAASKSNIDLELV